jgi:hypothetical protein
MVQVNFTPVIDDNWKKNSDKIIKVLESKKSKFIKDLQLNSSYIYLKIAAFPFILLLKLFIFIINMSYE